MDWNSFSVLFSTKKDPVGFIDSNLDISAMDP